MTATTRTGLVAVGIVFGSFALLTIGGWLLFRVPSITSLTNEPIGGVHERKSFERLVEGKEQEEVIRLVGKPDVVDPDPYSSYERWIYKNKTRHKDAKNTDAIAKVLIKDGKCIGVTFPSDASK
jgi:outer membrane protein assembly factor BamE (lipoprotein component of BamABCDE complex)